MTLFSCWCHRKSVSSLLSRPLAEVDGGVSSLRNVKVDLNIIFLEIDFQISNKGRWLWSHAHIRAYLIICPQTTQYKKISNLLPQISWICQRLKIPVNDFKGIYVEIKKIFYLSVYLSRESEKERVKIIFQYDAFFLRKDKKYQ